MDEDPFSGYGLKPVELTDKALLESYFSSLSDPLSDYTFSQLYTWRNSLRILWKLIDGHLCVFANGTGDLTLLMPPIGDTGSDKALLSAGQIMDDYNAKHEVPDHSRVEYVSEELLNRFDRSLLQLEPMGADYVYDTARMIDLAGGDLASKRQAKNRFMRNHEFRVEPYSAAAHRDGCVALLESWKDRQDDSHESEPGSAGIKRAKESIATRLCLDSAHELGLKGMVVYAKERAQAGATDASALTLRGFTFGEWLGSSQSSIIIEKTDLACKGLAQFIFSEFCQREWATQPLVNVGDDWGLPSLAWTKQSYRPVRMLQKYTFRRQKAVMVAAA